MMPKRKSKNRKRKSQDSSVAALTAPRTVYLQDIDHTFEKDEYKRALEEKFELSLALLDSSDLASARNIQEELVEIWERLEGLKSYNALRVSNSLGVTLQRLGLLREARALQESVLEGIEGLPTLEERNTQTFAFMAMQNLAATLRQSEDLSALSTLEDELVRRSAKLYGVNDHETIGVMEWAALTKTQLADYRRAESLRQRILEAYIAQSGSSDRSALEAGYNLAVSKMLMKEFAAAKELLALLADTSSKELPRGDRLTEAIENAAREIDINAFNPDATIALSFDESTHKEQNG
jgi:Tetratricopeptide repeat